MSAPVRQLLLYNPRSSSARKPVLPMSLLALGAVLEGRRDYEILDGNLDPRPLDALHARIAGRAAETVLGVTVMPGPQLQDAVPLCRELKRRHPALRVAWGGYFPTQHWEACLRSEFVDVVARGHAEHVFARWLDHQDTGSPEPDAIPGLAWRDGGEPRTTGMPLLPVPAELPEWNLDRVPVTKYLRHTFLGRRTLGYHSSYGCPFFCNFCAVVNMVNGRWLAQPAERVARAVKRYRSSYGVDAVEFVDNNFFTHEARVAEIAERVKGDGVAFWGEGRIDTMLAFSDATWRAMKDGGLKMVFLGAESASAETLARMDKGGRLTPEQTVDLVRRMREFGVVPELSFVLGSPPDPEADIERNIAFIRKLMAINPETEIVLYLYTPVPLEGDLLAGARASGFRFPETLEDWVSPEWLEFTQRRSGRLPWLSRSPHRKLRDFERVLHAYYPTASAFSLGRLGRGLLRGLASWRYRSGVYAWSLELAAARRLARLERPETSGF